MRIIISIIAFILAMAALAISIRNFIISRRSRIGKINNLCEKIKFEFCEREFLIDKSTITNYELYFINIINDKISKGELLSDEEFKKCRNFFYSHRELGIDIGRFFDYFALHTKSEIKREIVLFLSKIHNLITKHNIRSYLIFELENNRGFKLIKKYPEVYKEALDYITLEEKAISKIVNDLNAKIE